MRVVEISTVLEQAAGYIHYNARCPSSRSAKYFADSGTGRLLLLRKCIIVLRFTALLVCDALLVEFLRANVKVAGCLPLLRGTSCMLEDATAKLVLAGYATAISSLLRAGTLLYLPLAVHAIFFPPSFAHTVIIFSGRRASWQTKQNHAQGLCGHRGGDGGGYLGGGRTRCQKRRPRRAGPGAARGGRGSHGRPRSTEGRSDSGTPERETDGAGTGYVRRMERYKRSGLHSLGETRMRRNPPQLCRRPTVAAVQNRDGTALAETERGEAHGAPLASANRTRALVSEVRLGQSISAVRAQRDGARASLGGASFLLLRGQLDPTIPLAARSAAVAACPSSVSRERSWGGGGVGMGTRKPTGRRYRGRHKQVRRGNGED